MTNIYIIHSGIAHVSPYMTSLKSELVDRGYSVEFVPDIYHYCFKKIGYIYLHRLGRLYNNASEESINSFISRIAYLKKLGFKILWTIHNFYPLSTISNSLDEIVIKKLAYLCDHIFVHTDYMKKNAEKLFKRNVINHGYGTNLSLNNINDDLLIPTIRKSEYNLCFVGNIRDYKDIDLLLNSFLMINRDIYKINLYILGPFYNHDTSLKIFLNKCLNNNITIIDNFFHNLYELAEKFDAFVCTYNINFPQFKMGFFASSIASLGIYNKPIICPECESVLDIIKTRDNAILYKSGEADSLKEAICRLYDMSKENQNKMSNKLKLHLLKQSWYNVVDIIHGTITKDKW